MKEYINVIVDVAEGAQPPEYQSSGASGADVRAYLNDPIIVDGGASALIPTGIKVAIPEGYEIQVRPRSGMALKNMITVLNTPGTIDSDYRGEIGVIIINHGKEPFVIMPKMRIAQLVLAPVAHATFVAEKQLAMSTRGSGGFGHTGE
ncbi:MAG: dUTP diphosphatase [Waddliaceae bacterium]|jgi:dUTP pyrophosphatase|nr:dUTP diphosphatase [Waddliaceae bacterium]MBT3579425.1 dUTP diphosphatase [Waddliaceae bacterium]MBT4445178.1 dUTP diphosphatase [Waddliaceae bacterium]MBT6928157.1 dUTP diphosphatase [Waddliaceae bacterium]MBT7264490.1 dUTP diphosphatase [Waddliaceae bacterium]